MKVDPKTGMRYDHSPEEWAQVLRRHGAGMSLPASVAVQWRVPGRRPPKKGRRPPDRTEA